jgi:hypothetical protein
MYIADACSTPILRLRGIRNKFFTDERLRGCSYLQFLIVVIILLSFLYLLSSITSNIQTQAAGPQTRP